MSEPNRAPGARARVLIVDDERGIRDALVRAFETDHDVETAVDGEDGLRVALAFSPDIVLTDMNMPRKSGDALVRDLRAQRAFDGVPIILLTAMADEDVRVRVLKEGAQDYVLKPFNIGEVMTRAQNLLAMKRTRELLQREVDGQQKDLAALAQEVVQRQHQVEAALEEMTIARDLAAEASAVKSTFLDLVSHELRTPLTIIQLGLQTTLARPGAPSDSDRKTLERVMAASNRLGELVESLLARTDSESSMSLSVVPLDVAALVNTVAQEYMQPATAKNLALEIDIAPDLPPFTSDGRIVRRILRGLVDNAVKFTSAGRVRIRALGAHGPTGVQLVVEDTGRGIALSDQERVFSAFETGEVIQHKHTPGLGLGLAIVRASTRLVGGTVTLASGAGKGTAFTVTLPTLAPPASAPA